MGGRPWGPPRGAHLPPAPPTHLRVPPLPPHFSLVDGVQVGAVTAALVLGVKAAIAHCRGGEGGRGGVQLVDEWGGGLRSELQSSPRTPPTIPVLTPTHSSPHTPRSDLRFPHSTPRAPITDPPHPPPYPALLSLHPQADPTALTTRPSAPHYLFGVPNAPYQPRLCPTGLYVTPGPRIQPCPPPG